MSADVLYFWRLVGTDLEVRVAPPLDGSGGWAMQAAPTGLLTIHLAGSPGEPLPVEELPVRPDPLDPIETPGRTDVIPATWDVELERWEATHAAWELEDDTYPS